jgi:hypothetical protein
LPFRFSRRSREGSAVRRKSTVFCLQRDHFDPGTDHQRHAVGKLAARYARD